MELMERRRILLNTPHIDIVTGLQFVTDMVAPLESLVISFSPIQDLHGYDSPWPGGGGKNKANFDVTFPIVKNGITISKNDDGSISINGTATANFTATLMSTVDIDSGAWTISGVPANSAGGSLSIWARNQNGGNEYARAYNGLSGTLNISTGSVYIYCTISAGVTVDNVKCFIQLESGSTATTFAPYSNICPISGWTGLDVTRTGKNLVDYAQFVAGVVNTDGLLNKDVESVISIGNDAVTWTTSKSWKAVSSGFSEVKGGQTVKPSASGGVAYLIISWYDETKAFIRRDVLNANNNLTASAPTNACYFRLSLQSSTAGTFTYSNIQVEYGSTTTSYEPYQGDTYSITFPTEAGTVYGGTLDVTSGVLTVDRAMVDLGSRSWEYAKKYGFLSELPGAKPFSTNISTIICSKYATTRYTINPPDFTIALGGWSLGTRLLVADSTFGTDATAFKNGSVGVQLCYELATPQTYQLTPQQVLTLKGTNNLLSNSNGGMTVNYWTHLD